MKSFTTKILTTLLAIAAILVSQVASTHSSHRRLNPLHHRAKEMCGDWDKVEVGPYMLMNNLWNKGAGSGKQCISLDSESPLAWSSTWSWSGGKTSPKSYPNVVVKVQQVQLSKIASIMSKWSWTYTGQGLRADVAYDLFTSDSPGSAKKFEIMIWLAVYDVNPIASSYGSNGKAVAAQENVAIEGHKWTLYQGSNEGATVLSFIPTDGKPINSFSGDLNGFFKWLVDQKKMTANQYLLSVGAGSEPFEGQNAKFTTTSYSAEPKFK